MVNFSRVVEISSYCQRFYFVEKDIVMADFIKKSIKTKLKAYLAD